MNQPQLDTYNILLAQNIDNIYCGFICAYAVMSNHIPLVVKLNPAELEALSPIDIAQRWACLFKGPLLLQKWLRDNNTLDTIETETVLDTIEVYRQRLTELGWFMKCSTNIAHQNITPPNAA